MISPKQKQFRYFNLSKSKYSPRSTTNSINLLSKERTQKNNQTEHSSNYDYEKQSIASTYDSSQRTKIVKHLRSDSSNFKHKEKYNYISQITSTEKQQKARLDTPNISKYEINNKNIIFSQAIAANDKINIDNYSNYLRRSPEANFNKKISSTVFHKNRLEENSCKNLEKIEKKQIKSPMYQSSNKSSQNHPFKTSPFDSLEKQDHSFKIIQDKQINVESLKINNQQINKSKTTSTESQQLTISDFQLGKNCGKGTYGSVCIARLKSNGTLFALKKISKEIVRKNKMQAQIALQIKLQMYIDHPNVLKLYHFFDDQKYVYLIMQYMQEGSLFDYIQNKNDKMSQKETAQIIIQISNALVYLHDRFVIHRDIKPQNIVISNGVRKLCDFGWATVCINRRSTYCGTFDYAAPQILQGKQYDNCVDLWCLGVLTYQLLTRKVPFYDVSRKQSIKKIINSDKQGAVFPKQISTKCRHFIQCLMKKQPKQRMTAQDLHSHPFLALYIPQQKFFY